MLLSVLKDIFFSKAGAQTPEALSQAPWRTVVEPPAQVPAAPAPASGPALPLPKTLADLLQEPASPPPGSVQLDENLSLVSGRHGIFLANRFDRHLGCALDRYGECKELQLRLIQTLVGSGDTVVEVGASIGAHTVPLAKKVGPEGRVVAIEPQPVIAQALAANVALNSLENVSVVNSACGAQASTLWRPSVNYFGGAFHLSGAVQLSAQPLDSGAAVDVRTLDDLLGDSTQVSLLRVEVSGMELEVLRGAVQLLRGEADGPASRRPTLYVANAVAESSPALIEHLQALGYRLWWHLPALFNPDNFFGRNKNDYDDSCDVCLVGLPEGLPVPPEVMRLTPVFSAADHPLKRSAVALP